MTEISKSNTVRHSIKRASINIQKDIDVLTEWNYTNDSTTTISSSNSKAEKIPFIFDDIAWHFNWITFFHQLLVHIIPFGFLSVNYSAQGFIPKDLKYFILQVFSVLFVYLLVFAYAMCRDDEQRVIAQGCYLPVVLFFLHKTTIALKYACLSPTEAKRINSEKNQAVSENYQLQMQLITGWLLQRSDVLQFELGAAAVRLGAKINEMYFAVPNPNSSSFTRKQFLVWNNLLRCDCENASAASVAVLAHDSMDDDTESKSPAAAELEVQVVEQLKLQQDGSYIVSVFDTVMAIIKLAARDRFAVITFKTHLRLSQVVVFLFLSVPILEMIYARQPLSFYSGWFYVYLILSTYITYVYGAIYCTLLYAVVFDVKRQETMHTLLRAMIRSTDLDPESRKILGEEETDAVDRLARDNVCALFSINRDMKSTFIVKGAEPLLPPHADSPTLDNSKDAVVPQLCITHPQNVLCWVYARLVIQNFGLRFRHRMDLVAADAIVIHALVVGVQFVMVLLNHNTQEVAFSCGFIQMLISINVSLLCVIALFKAGAAVNDAYAQHKNALATQSLRLRNHAATLRHLRAAKEFEIQDENKDDEKIASASAEMAKLEQAVQLLDSCQSMLTVSNAQGAFKVMGVTAEPSISQYLISSSISFFVMYFAVALPGFRSFLFTSQSA